MLAAFAQLFSSGLSAVDLGRTPSVMISAQTCVGCHAAVHGEWKQSGHGRAWTNALFQREYQERPLEWCVHCHAPLALQLAEVRRGGGRLADEGVTCAVCHVRNAQVIAARRRAGSPHNTKVDEEFGQPHFCAGCHQFSFPRFDATGSTVVGYGTQPMQDTVAQHAAGPDADTPCTGCHARSPARHRMPGGHDPEMLNKAFATSVCSDGSAVVVSVENRGAGHRLPTGDVHRHLALRVWRSSAPERLWEVLWLRRFRALDDGGKELVEDSTLAPREVRRSRVELAQLGGAVDEAISVELRLVFTIDEFPLSIRPVAAPTYAVVWRQRGLVPACAVPVVPAVYGVGTPLAGRGAISP